MAITLQVPSRITNAVIFFVVDIFGLWAIHRGLKGLQSYYFYRLARTGRSVHLARSRVPIFSGELLQGGTRTGVIFVLANAAAIVLAFLATLEVNGETVLVLNPVPLTNVATVVGGSVDYDESSNFYSTLSSCATRNTTHFGYWPVTFSIDKNKSEEDYIVPLNPVCQVEVPGFQPLVMTECITLLPGKSCNVYDKRPGLLMNATIAKSSRKNWSTLVSEFTFSATTAQAFNPESGSYDMLTGKEGFAFIFREPLEQEAHRNTALLFLDNRENNSWFIAYGELHNNDSTRAAFGLFRPAKLSPASLLPDNANFLESRGLRFPEAYPRIEIPVTNIPAIIEFLFINSFGNSNNTRQAFTKEPKDVTVISTAGMVLYGVICATFILLFFMKELLMFIIRQRGTQPHEAFATDFDQLSRSLRRSMEREHDMAYSGDFAVLGVDEDAQGSSQVRPIVSRS